jgi:parallel beta-helix repeat protein
MNNEEHEGAGASGDGLGSPIEIDDHDGSDQEEVDAVEPHVAAPDAADDDLAEAVAGPTVPDGESDDTADELVVWSSQDNPWSSSAVQASDRDRLLMLAMRERHWLQRVTDLSRPRPIRTPQEHQTRWTVVGAMAALGTLVLTAFIAGMVLKGDGTTIVAPVALDENGLPVASVGSTAALPLPFVPIDPNAPRVCPLPDDRPDTSTLETLSSRQTVPYSPFRLVNFPCANFPGDFRVALLYRDAVVLVEGGDIVRQIPFDAAEEVAFSAIVEAVNDSAWIGEVSDGVFQVDTALVQMPGTSLRIGAPEVAEVRLTSRRHVFLGGRGATVRIEGATVTSWDTTRSGPDIEPSDGRPFILYEQGSRLDIIDSEITYLGSDRTGGAYGTAWRLGGSTGTVTGSTFANNWFGVYTLEAKDLVFRGNVFADNAVYGLDPHDYSSGLIVEGNVAYGNGSHGLIFSEGVVDSVMRNNHVFDNGGNGIVLDRNSNRNVIEANLVENNRKDGIVLIGSGESSIVDNTVRGHRTGIRVNGAGSTDVTITGNTIEQSQTGIHAYEGAGDLTIRDNTVSVASRAGIIMDGGVATIAGIDITAAPVGIEVRTAVGLSDAAISDADFGLVSRGLGILDVRDVAIDAEDAGIRVFPGASANVGPRVEVEAAQRIMVTTGEVSWHVFLPWVGIAAIVTAVALEVMRGTRTRGERERLAPPMVVNWR